MLPGMELFDSLSVVALFAVLLCALIRRPRWDLWSAVLLGIAALCTVIHLISEGARWQMVPVYLVLTIALLVGLIALWRRSGESVLHGKWLRLTVSVLGMLLLGVAVLASYTFPMFELPRPAGPFAVATDEFHLVDLARAEAGTANPLDHRELMVRVWYPAEPSGQQRPEPYWRHAKQAAQAINERHWPLGYLVSHLQLVPTHSSWAAPLSRQQGSYPVLIFSHGLGTGGAVQNTVLMEELASRGYVLFSIDHTYGGIAATFPDGRVALFDDDAYSAKESQPPTGELLKLFEQARKSKDVRDLTSLMERLAREQPLGTQVFRYWQDVWSQDQRFVIDSAAKMQSGEMPSRFKGHLQLDRIGVMGMSFGGSSSTTTRSADARCKAGINLDGTIGTALQTPPLRVPFMYFSNGSSGMNRVSYERDVDYRYLVQIAGSGHLDHSDAPYITHLFEWLGDGDRKVIGAQRVVNVVNDYVRAFFDQHLLGQPQALLTGPSGSHPEVTFMHSAPREISAAAATVETRNLPGVTHE